MISMDLIVNEIETIFKKAYENGIDGADYASVTYIKKEDGTGYWLSIAFFLNEDRVQSCIIDLESQERWFSY